MVLSVVNIVFLSIMIYIFTLRYREISSRFNLGFLLIVVALLLRTFFSSPIIRLALLHEEVHSLVDPYRLVADIFETIALCTFLLISLE